MTTATFPALQERLREFNADRDWEQFHTPRNLLLALSGEVGELASLFQWVPDGDVQEWMQTRANRQRAEEELADVFAYVLQFADSLRIDPLSALSDKIDLNGQRYPVSLSKGSAKKYSAFGSADQEEG